MTLTQKQNLDIKENKFFNVDEYLNQFSNPFSVGDIVIVVDPDVRQNYPLKYRITDILGNRIFFTNLDEKYEDTLPFCCFRRITPLTLETL